MQAINFTNNNNTRTTKLVMVNITYESYDMTLSRRFQYINGENKYDVVWHTGYRADAIR